MREKIYILEDGIVRRYRVAWRIGDWKKALLEN
jgi:hypothetical protein